MPYDPDRVLRSSQVQARPTTPPTAIRSIHIPDTIFSTPRRSQDLYRARQQLERLESLSRSTRTVIAKAGKAISIANTRSAQLETLNTQLQHQLNRYTITKPRRRIPDNPNERFKNVEAIRAAVELYTTDVAQQTRQPHRKLATTPANASLDTVFNSMCNEWQI